VLIICYDQFRSSHKIERICHLEIESNLIFQGKSLREDLEYRVNLSSRILYLYREVAHGGRSLHTNDMSLYL